MSSRVRVALERLSAGERSLDGAAAHYLGRVHRLGAGDRFTAFDPSARREADVEIVAVERGVLRCRCSEPRPARVVGEPGLTLIQCLAKGEKLDDVVRSATALGVSTVVLAESERSEGRSKGRQQRSERLRAVALDAARQSGRGDLPEILGPFPLAEVLANFRTKALHKLCLHPQADQGLGAALAARGARALALLVGPEGGFGAEELASAALSGFTLVNLGPLVLRTELAGVAALGAALAARSDS
jgi:16S rRNA (uracil1498-N3)-methyltransferase